MGDHYRKVITVNHVRYSVEKIAELTGLSPYTVYRWLHEGRRFSDAIMKPAQTHCKRGHKLEGDNIVITSQGHRQCVACKKLTRALWRKARKKAGLEYRY